MKLVLLFFGVIAAAQWDSKFLDPKCKNNERPVNGICNNGCADNFSKDADGYCIVPKCTADCGSGVCTGGTPQCSCFTNYANGDDGGCYSMRLAGLKGAMIALVVISSAITTCHIIQTKVTKGQ